MITPAQRFLRDVKAAGLDSDYIQRINELLADGHSHPRAKQKAKGEFLLKIRDWKARPAPVPEPEPPEVLEPLTIDSPVPPPEQIREEAPAAPPPAPPAEPARKKKERANLSRDIEWVYQHCALSENALLNARRNAPSAGALGWLDWVRADDKNKNDFYKNIVPRVLMTQAKLDDEQRRATEARPIYELIERTLQNAKLAAEAADEPLVQESTQDAGREPEVPAIPA